MTSDELTVALWALNLDQDLAGPEQFVEQVDGRLAEAAAAGAELLMLPEYTSALWLSYAPAGTGAGAEVAWMAAQAEREILPALPGLARRHGVALLAGSAPARAADGHRNRAHLFLPDGRQVGQDKLCLTPVEREADSWLLVPGDSLRIVQWRGWRIAILICLDVEQPSLAARLVAEDLDLVLVPSQTARPSGFARVTACARARAIELFCGAAVCGCIGPAGAERFGNAGGAAAYLPCERALGSIGTVVEEGPFPEVEGPGPLTIATLPLGAIRRLRKGAAEVWPGPWSAAGVRIARD